MKITRRKDGRWQCKVTVEGEEKPKYFYSSEKSERKAEKDIQQQIVSYNGKVEKGKTVVEVADEWEAYHEPLVEWSTHHRYKPCVQRIREWFKGVYIKDVTVIQASRFLENFALEYPVQKTVKNQKTVANQIWKYAILKGYIEANNIWQYVPFPKGLKKPYRDIPTDSEIKSVQVYDEKAGLFAYFLLYTGLRRGEILALRYCDIDFDNKIIHVENQIAHQSNKPVLKQPKTKSGVRDIILLDRLAEKLKKSKSKKYIFGNDKGEPLTQSQFNKMWKKTKELLGIDITPHQLRHAYATMLYEAGVDIKDAQILLGHSDESVTRQTYTHIRTARTKATANKLNSFEF